MLGLETTNSHMARLGKREVLGVEQTSPEQQVESYRKVTAKEILSLAQEMLAISPAIAVVSSQDYDRIRSLIH